MKTYKISFFVAFIFLISSACEGVLDREEKDVLPASQVLNTLAGVEAIMFQVYERARTIHENNDISLYKQCGTDLVVNGTNMVDVPVGGMLGMNTYNLTANSDQLNTIWDAYYQAIARCNQVIQASDDFPTNSTDQEETLRKFRGEALAMRGYVYLELVRRWENIPLAIPLPDGAPPVREANLSEKAAIYDLILQDLTEALTILPARVGTAGVGSPSKGLANLVLAEAHMDLGNYAEAAAACEAVISDESYALQPLDNIFGLEGGKEGEESNNEIIFSWVFDPAVDNRRQRTSQMYVPLYDRVVGIARTLAQGGRPWSRFSPSEYYWSLFDEEDGRLEAWHKTSWTIDDEENVLDGWDLSNGDVVPREYVLEWADGSPNQERYTEPTTTKFWEDGTYGRGDSDAEGFRNVIVYRFAHAYILGAEAYFRSGNTQRALELINTIRDRAFGDTEHRFTALDEEILLEEHARELGHEGHRWATLKRLGLLVERVQQHNPDGADNVQENYTRWPIPQSFIDLAGVKQNPGY